MPTAPQTAGWPAIQRGDHTLILAPTGSGKTLAAFLWGIDEIYRSADISGPATQGAVHSTPGVRLLYISPLKALNNDIERNLRAPITGIRQAAARLGQELPPLRVAVRTGDTPASLRAAMVKQPPQILITTPESLYLLLTSPRAREMLRSVRSVIVDEIHTLVGEKRGVHLALSLERLAQLTGARVQRIGLSATVRPLEEAARFLGGQEWRIADDKSHIEICRSDIAASPPLILSPRPVTIVDTGYRKPLDLLVVTPVDDFRNLPGNSIWPVVIPQVVGDIMRHRSTLIFCNNRRLAERTADRLNAQISAERSEEVEPGSSAVLAPNGIMRDRGLFALGAEGPIRAHHGSMSKEARREMEEALKAGTLPALVGTSSLELGIDIGAVDLVVQLQSPKSVSQGLQRVGRSGHLVGQTSRGRIYATYREDLVEAAAVARGMLEGDVEPTATPRNPLDVLAQQIMAQVSVEDYSTAALFDLIRQAYPYQDLSRFVFDGVLDMLSGKYQQLGGPGHTALRARLAWDRVNDRLAALPGTRLLALGNPGVIPDTGAFNVYLADGKTRIGALDEEFIHESRVGDVFLLGSSTWRIQEINADRVVVGDAAGALPRMPFWRGDYPWRPFALGQRIGRLRREVAERLKEDPSAVSGHPQSAITTWLQHDYALDARSAHGLLDYVAGQLQAVGVISSDRTIVVESFLDAIGDPRLVVHSPFGGRVNGAWALALSDALAERFGMPVETQSDDDGILMRLPQTEGPAPVDVIRDMTFAEARERILRELPGSSLFGARFRMNAARALLLPKARGQRRTPFWLQRLRAKDLLATVLPYEDFPLVAETYRDCLADVLDMPHLEEVLSGLGAGRIEVVSIETVVPSPIAAGMLFNFVNVYMYEWDAPKAERQLQTLALRGELLDDLLAGSQTAAFPKPEVVAEAVARAAHTGALHGARSADELAVFLVELGDLTTAEAVTRCIGDGMGWLTQLAAAGRITEIAIPTHHGPERRWVTAELAAEYREAFEADGQKTLGEKFSSPPINILRRFLRHAGPVTQHEIRARYAFPATWLVETLADLVATREVVQGQFAPKEDASPQYCDRGLFEQIQRRTLALLRREVQPVAIAAYADFLLDWHGLRRSGAGDHHESRLQTALEQLRGIALPGILWERDLLPGRVPGFQTADLAALCESGAWVWVATGHDPRRASVRFFERGQGRLFLGPPAEGELNETSRCVLGYLREEGASFLVDLQGALGLGPADLRSAVIELVLAGLVTNDTLGGLHALLESRPDSEREAPRSALEEELAARLSPRPISGIPTRERYQSAKRRVTQRLRGQISEGSDSSLWRGRWGAVHRAGILGPARSEAELAQAAARLLLARYGIITREIVARDAGLWDWDALYAPLQRMELRGEIRRGYFVTGLSGVQFALPEAVEQLRARAAALQSDDRLVALVAADPANLYGGEGLADAPTFARQPATHVILWRGQPALVAEDNGERLTVAADATPELLTRALQAYLTRPNAPRRVTVGHWNGVPVLDSAGLGILQALGFNRTPTTLERWT